ncbi:MAG: hypothetical protein ISR95_09290 [Candidatus Marinimicrobia bacterium]|nr:hypothetical protein [Candidatus Neomarinimicrobiota bacterium]
MNIITKLGLFLILFALIVFGSKLLLSKKTREQLKDMEPVSPQFKILNRVLARLIIILVLAMILFFIMTR